MLRCDGQQKQLKDIPHTVQSVHELHSVLTSIKKYIVCKGNEYMNDTESWTNILDRGGLYHVSDATYDFFHEMEMVLLMERGMRQKKFLNL